VAEDEFADSGALGDATDLGHIGVQRGHPGQFGIVRAVTPQVAQVGHLVDQDVGVLGQSDQVLVHRGVAGEHHRAVRGVEPVRQRRDRPAVRHRDRGDPDAVVVNDDDRNLGAIVRPCRGGDVDGPDERAGIRHMAVQRHDVQMVGVTGQDVGDQVRRARCGQLGGDRRLTVEDGIPRWQGAGA
jgi:hypothetical protein